MPEPEEKLTKPEPKGEAKTAKGDASADPKVDAAARTEARPDDDESSLGDLPKAVRQRIESYVPELVKRGFAAGMGALLTSEEGIRRLTKELTKEMPLPKDIAGYLVSTASSSKDELLRIIAREVREFLQTVNLSEEIAKMLTTLSFEIKTEIRFIPNDEKYSGVEPDVKARVRLKRSEDKRTRRRRRRKRDDDGSNGTAGDTDE